MSGADKITIKYHGGMADNGQLNFYEYSRAVYSVSRIILTIDHFRRTGEVIHKITKDRVSNVVISAPRRGSFPIEMVIPFAAEAAAVAATSVIPALQGMPVSTILEYLIDGVLGREKPSRELEPVLEYIKGRDANELSRDRVQSESMQNAFQLLQRQMDLIEQQSATQSDLLKFLILSKESGVYFHPKYSHRQKETESFETFPLKYAEVETMKIMQARLRNQQNNLMLLELNSAHKFKTLPSPLDHPLVRFISLQTTMKILPYDWIGRILRVCISEG